MTSAQDEETLSSYFHQIIGAAPTSVTALRPHASERRMYRLSTNSVSLIGVVNPSRKENDAFVAFARHFQTRGLPCPTIHLYKPTEYLYLEEDLGNETLFDFLSSARSRSGEVFPASAELLYRQCLEWLPQFQIKCANDLDFSLCHPEQHLLPGTFASDCTTFATELVSRLTPAFDITRLAGDFATLISYLEKSSASFFVYRDFQSRNIMHRDGKLYFIDFQSGCRGPLQYDVVSLLYQSSTQLPSDARSRLAQHYCSVAAHYTELDVKAFHQYYSGFVISRMIQVLGVYGRQGLGAGKEYFAQSIPLAISTLSRELNDPDAAIKLPAITRCVEGLVERLAAGKPL